MSARASREDWVTAGLDLLREEGEGALRIERLCERLSRTKGSFYHHFEGLSAFHDAMLAQWEQALTERLIEEADRSEGATNRRVAIGRLARGLDVRLELAIRAWGLREARARAAVERVDARRVAYLEELWAAVTGRRAGARALARLEYAAYVGAQQIHGELGERSARELEATLERALRVIADEAGPRRS